MNQEILIRASDFNSFSYCERKWLFQKDAKTAAPPTQQMENGKMAHKELDDKFLNEALTQISFKDFIKSETRIRTRPDASEALLKAKIGDISLVGKIDEAVSDMTGVYVIDDKAKDVAYDGCKLQVWAYCYLVCKNFVRELGNKRIFGMLRCTANGETFWREEFTRENQEKLLEALFRMKFIIRKELTEKPSKNEAKCGQCPFRALCYSITD